MRFRRLCGIVLIAWFFHGTFAVAAGLAFPIEGRLTEPNGKPVDGPVSLTVEFFHVAKGGTPVLAVSEGLEEVALQEGVFQLRLSLTPADYQKVFPSVSQRVFVEVTDMTHAANAPYPRFEVGMTPYAGKVPVDGKTTSFDAAGQLTVGPASAPSAGQFLTKDSGGSLVWATPDSGGGSGGGSGTFTSVSSSVTSTAASGSVAGVQITPTYDQPSSTAANTDLLVNRTETAVGSGAQRLMDLQVGGTTKFHVASSGDAYFAGKVGIGTTSPSEKLTVVGNGKFVGPDVLTTVNLVPGSWTGSVGVTTANGTSSASGNVFATTGGSAAWGLDGGHSGPQSAPFVVKSNGTERLRIDSAGNVGIGTTAPTANLTVRKDATSALGPTIYLQNFGNSGSEAIDFAGYDDGGQNPAARLLVSDYSYSANFSFLSRAPGPNQATTLLERMRITTDGDVGIGTSSPLSRLDVYGSVTIRNNGGSMAALRLYPEQGASSWFTLQSTINDGSGNTNYDLALNPNGGNVGVGTTAPAAALDVKGQTLTALTGTVSVTAGSTVVNGSGTLFTSEVFPGDAITIDAESRVVSNVGNNGQLYLMSSHTAGASGVPAFIGSALMKVQSGGATRLAVDRTGRVGIGTGSPSVRLQVVNGSGQAQTTGWSTVTKRYAAGVPMLQVTDNLNSEAGIGVRTTDGTHADAAQFFVANTKAWGLDKIGDPLPFVISVSNTERLRIDESGNVGIGTQTPQATLDVNGTMRLALNSSEPFSCDATHDGALALTHLYTMCVCKGGAPGWVSVNDGSSACAW